MFKELDEAQAARDLSWAIHERKHWEDSPRYFFRAWKVAVEIAGIRNFGDGTVLNYTLARTLAELAPNTQRIEEHFGTKSPAEKCFLALLVSAFNSELGRPLWVQASIKGFDALTLLDLKRRSIISMLLLHHTGR